jgi:hypothetical protein
MTSNNALWATSGALRMPAAPERRCQAIQTDDIDHLSDAITHK